MKITDSDIKKICSSGIYKSGMDYFKEGRVHIRVRAEDSIVAAVDSDKLYNVHIGFDKSGKICDTFCTCPYYQTMSANCKHIVAVLEARRAELEGGEDFVNDNDRTARLLCKDFEKQKTEKIQLHAGFIFNINTNHRRECSYSVSLILGDGSTPIAGIESFLDAFITGKEYKLSKHKSYDNSRYCFGSYDEHILTVLAEAYQNKTSGTAVYTPKLTAADFGAFTARRLLPLLRGADCRFVLNGMPQNNLLIKTEDPDILVDITATDDNINISIPQSGLAVIPDGSWFLYEGDLYETSQKWRSWFMPLYNALSTESRTQIDFSGSNSVAFAAEVLPALKGEKGVVAQGIENVVVDDRPGFDVYFDRDDDGISAAVTVTYGKITFNLPCGEDIEKDKIIVRDYIDEKYLLSFFSNFHPDGKRLYLDGSDEIYGFFENSYEKIAGLARIHVSDSFSAMKNAPVPALHSTVSYSGAVDLLEVGFETDITPAEIAGILNAIRHRKSYFRMQNGNFLTIDDRLSDFEVLGNLDFSYSDIQQKKKKISKYYALYLSGAVKNGNAESDGSFDDFVESIKNIRADIPEYLETILRDYQKDGVHWMTQLSRLGFGGVLADDMGLGKTLEVIAFVMSEKPKKPVLVVAPSSLTYNWLSEITRFAPEARAEIADGSKEDRIRRLDSISDCDFVITSYTMLRRDIQKYAEMEFSYCFIDEAQHIKNPKTLSSKAVKKINCTGCFALSGTPIENSLTELWSIFDFVMPGYLGTHQQFVQRYEKPVTKEGDENAAAMLRGKIKPFVMRRMKYDVLDELPDKIENVFFAELEPQQKKLYAAYLAAARHEAAEIVKYGGDNMRILSLLMRLRQICCHPKLIDEGYEKDSGKLLLLEELVRSAVASGHRILIFSQFTSMLSIIQKQLEKADISSFYLDGHTPSFERTGMADRFNKGERSVFLISLKAGGTGLNLIGADMVIHYDPWWNPAVTDQASDRAYRIGQTKVVHVIKLASKGTIEEQIIKLQEKKRSLADNMICANSAVLSNLTKEEILNLFK